MKKRKQKKGFLLLSALLAVFLLFAWKDKTEKAKPREPSFSKDTTVIAIDILLEPDTTMINRAKSVNALLRQNYPQGYSLDASHSPHITLIQRFIHAGAMDSLVAGINRMAASQSLSQMQLSAVGYLSDVWAGSGVLVYVIEKTPQLLQLENNIVKAIEPFSVDNGTTAAFARDSGTEAINAETISWVKNFVPASSGEKYFPHVTIGVAEIDFVKNLQEKPFSKFTFSISSIGIYQLGNFGTARKKIWNSSQ